MPRKTYDVRINDLEDKIKKIDKKKLDFDQKQQDKIDEMKKQKKLLEKKRNAELGTKFLKEIHKAGLTYEEALELIRNHKK